MPTDLFFSGAHSHVNSSKRRGKKEREPYYRDSGVRNWIQHAVELLLTTEKKAKRKQLAVFLVEDQSTSTIEGADHS